MPIPFAHNPSGGNARTIVLLAVLFVLAWINIARAWDHAPTYPRHLHHRHVITKPVNTPMERLPAWHRDAG